MSLVRLDFFPAHDLNGTSLFTMTEEDDYFMQIELRPELGRLGGGVFTAHRRVGAAMFDNGVFQPEVFVRVNIPQVDATKYIWGFFLDLRKQVLIAEEEGTERFVMGGPGPLFYLSRAILWDEQFSGSGFAIDRDNGVFNFDGDDNAGQILIRLINEDIANTLATFLPDLTYDFTGSVDSAGAAWSDTVGSGFSLPIGEPYLSHLWSLQDAISNLDVTVDLGDIGAPTFEMRAWQALGVDRSTSSFAAGKIYLKEGENLEAPLEVTGTALRKATHALVRGRDAEWGRSAPYWDAGEYARAVMIDYPNSNSPFWLNRAGERFINRQINVDQEFDLAIRPGFDELNGYYFPGPFGTNGHLWYGDTVTIDTGAATSTPLDFADEEHRVTGFRMELRDAARDETDELAALSWNIWINLNHERGSDNSLGSHGDGSGAAVGPHNHPPNPQRCVAGTLTTSTPVLSTAYGDAFDESNPTFAYGTTVDGSTDAALVVLLANDPAELADEAEVYWQWNAGTSTDRVLFDRIAGPTDGMEVHLLVAPRAGTSGATVLVANARTNIVGVAYLTGLPGSYRGTAFARDTGSTSSVTITTESGDRVLNIGGQLENNIASFAAPTAGGGQTEIDTDTQNSSSGQRDAIMGFGHQVAAGTSVTPTWTFNASRAWWAVAIAFSGEGVGTVNDGHPDLVGSDDKVARCDHRHDVHRESAPTINDDWATQGYKVGTVWAQLDSLASPTEIVAVWVLADATEGAAVWLEWPGGNVAAEDVSYDNTASGLSSENVQDAIDELVVNIADISLWNEPVVAALSNPPTQTELETAIGENADTNAGQFWPVADSSNGYPYVVTSNGTRYWYIPFIASVGDPAGGVGGGGGGGDTGGTAYTLSDSPYGGWEKSKVIARAYNGETVWTYIRGDNGDIGVLVRKHSDGTTTSAIIGAAYEDDDHASPDVLVRDSDHRVLVYSSKHNGTSIIQKISNDGGTSLTASIASGFSYTNLDSQLGGTSYTYPNIIQLTGETSDPLYLFFRGSGAGVGQSWHYSRSTGSGSGVVPTWSTMTAYIQFSGRTPYPIMRGTSTTRIDFLMADGHWTTETDIDIYHFYYDGSTQTWHDTAGNADTLPFGRGQMTQVYDGTGEETRAQDVILSGGNPWVLFTKKVGSDDFRYMFSRWNGSAWTAAVEIDDDAEYTASGSNGTGGITFDRSDPNTVYYSKVVGGVMEMFTAVTADSGATWTPTAITTGSAADQFNPISPYDHEAELSVIWQNGSHDSYTDWLSGTEGY